MASTNRRIVPSIADKLNEHADELDELERLRRENAQLKAASNAGALRFKVSEKGALSVYGLGRFPVTLYREQWTRLLDVADAIRSFIEANADKLKTKGDES
jgi:hypothetical protein